MRNKNYIIISFFKIEIICEISNDTWIYRIEFINFIFKFYLYEIFYLLNTDEYLYHNCWENALEKCHFIIVKNNKKEIKFVVCQNCKKVYYSSFILARCNKCNLDYYTSLLTKDENPDLLLATWENYHCPQLINEKMKCIKCH